MSRIGAPVRGISGPGSAAINIKIYNIGGARHWPRKHCLEGRLRRSSRRPARRYSGGSRGRTSPQKALAGARADLEAEYDRIISEAGKEADKLRRQITGSADLEARNAQLRAVEEATDRVFAEAASRISSMPRDAAYSEILDSLISEAAGALGTSEIIVSACEADAEAAAAAARKAGAELAPERIECMGGVRVRTRDGATSFDNTLDARMERLKPLIRKEIASRFGLGD